MRDKTLEAQQEAQLEGLAIGLEQRGEKSAAHLIRIALRDLKMRAPKLSDADLNRMIDAGIKARDLYELAKNDIITRKDLSAFLRAALAEIGSR